MTSTTPIPAELLTSNATWATTFAKNHPNFFSQSAKGQQPKVVWIGCADSRVPESVITSSKPGDIFVTRNIANQFNLSDDSVQAVVAYAIEHLGATHVVVVGHTECGGIAAAYDAAYGSTQGDGHGSAGTDTPLTRYLVPLVALAKSLDLGSLTRAQALPKLRDANVQRQIDNLAKSDAVVNAWKAKKPVKLHGWIHQLENGVLRDLKITKLPPT